MLFSTPMVKLPTVSGFEHFFALHSQKLGDVSGSVHPHGENGRQLQALSIFCAFHSPELRTSQALCSPMMKIADSLRLGALPFTKIVGRLRLCAPPS